MSTRATISVIDDQDRFDIYRHHDGYPEGPFGVVAGIRAAISKAWPPPRLDAGDFAAALVAEMRGEGGGSIYLTRRAERHADREYHYEVRRPNQQLELAVRSFRSRARSVLIFEGTIEAAAEKFQSGPEASERGARLQDVWAALAMAEMALTDAPTARSKGYPALALGLIRPLMDARRAELQAAKGESPEQP